MSVSFQKYVRAGFGPALTKPELLAAIAGRRAALRSGAAAGFAAGAAGARGAGLDRGRAVAGRAAGAGIGVAFGIHWNTPGWLVVVVDDPYLPGGWTAHLNER